MNIKHQPFAKAEGSFCCSPKFGEIISYLENLDDEYYRVIPNAETLVKLYGDADGELFYSARDLYLNYQRRYIEEYQIEIYDVNDERQCFSRRY